MKASQLVSTEYNSYYGNYIRLLDDLELNIGLEHSFKAVIDFLESIPEENFDYSYAEGKWTLKEVVQHLIDCERVFSYRAFCIARYDKTAFPGFDQDEYAMTSRANSKRKEDLLNEYKTLRRSTIQLFNSFNEVSLKQIGEASGSPMSARAAGFIIIGHEKHHCNIIRERYF